MNFIQLARVSALLGYFGLLILLMVWIIWLRPIDTPRLPTSLSLLLLVGPLMFPLRGLLHGRPYTHAWVSLLALFYLFLGISEAWSDSAQPLLTALEIIFSTLLYLGAMFYARLRGKQLKEGAPQSDK
ncbi:MAG TPA: DUF2069 domain-containing protein [Gammaproteobacteria bacterium]